MFTKIIAFPCSVYCGRPDIVNAGSGESGYSEWCGESRYSECGVWGADIVDAGSGESGYSECRVRGERI
ncbi:unnamed protein product [Staurois parvus]|uniref:Uncharacterized protein n=1 Tax=Staurois parvus TaxID=386267 RepID=A0ABN9D0H8_9NEOB|nr:unnamed protein product [Staurois parvus]